MGRRKIDIDFDRVTEYAATHTVTECAKFFGVSYSWMWNYLYDNKIVTGGKPKAVNAKPDRNKQVMELHGSGMSVTGIARRFGISKQRVSQIIKAAKP